MKEEKDKKESFFKKIKTAWKNPKEKAKIELILYGAFMLGVLIFAKASTLTQSTNTHQEKNSKETFLSTIKDNYEYNIEIDIDDKSYYYKGKHLGYNETILMLPDRAFYKKNNAYYVLEDGSYILTSKDEVYPYLNYRYTDINNIKAYLKLSSREGNIYKVKIKDVVLNSSSTSYFNIEVNDLDKTITIDYTPLLKEEYNANNIKVILSFKNIDKIISLEE